MAQEDRVRWVVVDEQKVTRPVARRHVSATVVPAVPGWVA
jgi:hypothetical protein